MDTRRSEAVKKNIYIYLLCFSLVHDLTFVSLCPPDICNLNQFFISITIWYIRTIIIKMIVFKNYWKQSPTIQVVEGFVLEQPLSGVVADGSRQKHELLMETVESKRGDLFQASTWTALFGLPHNSFQNYFSHNFIRLCFFSTCSRRPLTLRFVRRMML